MLQRAASNAYSWWWASHIRTKQSKWLEQNLQDMEEKVQYVLKLIEEDGDSFARRAEMYYKKRPELISFVEESYRAYRALAERYDHISTELQNANNTIASVFPEQVQFAMEDDDDDAAHQAPKKAPTIPKGNIPKVPKAPKELKRIFTSAPNRLQSKKSIKVTASHPVAKSGLSNAEGLQEIDRLQKQILASQTKKEFVKSSYESGLAKYWEIENEIMEMQAKVSSLQDEFGAGTVIEDSEARTLMASVALKSCKETLAQLQQKQEQSAEEASIERRRITNAREKLNSIKEAFESGKTSQENPEANRDQEKAEASPDRQSTQAVKAVKFLDQEPSIDSQEKQDMEILREKIREHLDAGSDTSLSVTELAEQIDGLVNKVINLEASVSSQTALIKRLRMETDDLQAQIGTLEDEKAMLIDGKNDLREKLWEMEKRLVKLQELNQSVEGQNKNLQSQFSAANENVDRLTEKLGNVMPDEDVEDQNKNLNSPFSAANENVDRLTEKLGNVMPDKDAQATSRLESLPKGEESSSEVNPMSDKEGKIHTVTQPEQIEVSDTSEKEKARNDDKEEEKKKEHDLRPSRTDNSERSHDTNSAVETQEQETNEEGEPDWKQLFMNGMGNREKFLLDEYTTVLRNFKDVKKKFAEAENKSGDGLFNITVQLRELKSANAKKDELIRALKHKLSLLQSGLAEDNESEKSTLTESSIIETDDDKVNLTEQPDISPIEQKFRMSIDEVLEENLDFWLRFSSTFHQIQKFETEVKDLQSELLKIEDKQKKSDASSSAKYSLKSDVKPLYKHLREINTELSVWLETSVQLKDEVKSRFSSLCDIQEEITNALKESAEDDDFKFTSYQAAKFQGEILNMKQENNKVADELQAGMDHVTTLQLEVERALAKLDEEFKLSGSKHQENVPLQHSESRSRVPLRSFIFGSKQKKQKQSIFSCVHPVLQKKYNGLKAGMNM